MTGASKPSRHLWRNYLLVGGQEWGPSVRSFITHHLPCKVQGQQIIITFIISDTIVDTIIFVRIFLRRAKMADAVS